jgi:steroid 5-alpha reductase family enzyme
MDRGFLKDRVWAGYAVILCSYAVAAWLGAAVYLRAEGALWFRLLLADACATVLIWTVSYVFKNASIYDPYWSVQPVVILTLLLIQTGVRDLKTFLVYLIILFWGIRLTSNWAYSFRGLHTQDWRYDQIRQRTGRYFQIANLLGIQLMPTLIVYLCILPAAYHIVLGHAVPISSLIGLTISILGLTLQTIADFQLHAFRKRAADRKRVIRTGLWKYSRHPNYLGEILLWWGIYLMTLPANSDLWYLFIGAFLNTLLFLFISIPLADRHLSGYKESYETYKDQTRMLLPIPRFR